LAKITCSICGKQFESESAAHMPFCSRRCQEIDLSRWLGEEYGFPMEGREDVDETPDREESPNGDS